MSRLRAYAETGTCLLNTGPEVDRETKDIERMHRTGVKLYYEPDERVLRCYVQAHRSSSSDPEQFVFEYEADEGADVFDAFVRDTAAATERAGWRIRDDDSGVYVGLREGRQASPTTDVDATFDGVVSRLCDDDEEVDLAATNRRTAAGLARYVRDEFDDEHSIAISVGGRRARVASDADVVIVPDQSHTGLTEDTVALFESMRVDLLRSDLREQVDDLRSSVGGAEDLVGYLEDRSFGDSHDVTLRSSSSSLTVPAARWFGRAVVVGLLLVTAAGIWSQWGRAIELLTREMRFVVPARFGIRNALSSVVPSRFEYRSWLAVALAGLAVAAVAAVGVVGYGRERLMSGLLRTDHEVPDGSSTDGDAAGGNDTDVGDAASTDYVELTDTLDEISSVAGRQTAVGSLVDPMAEHGVDVVSGSKRYVYRHGPPFLGAVGGAAVAVAIYVLASPVGAAVSLLDANWAFFLDGMLTVATLVALAGTAVGVRAAWTRITGGVALVGTAIRTRIAGLTARLRNRGKAGRDRPLSAKRSGGPSWTRLAVGLAGVVVLAVVGVSIYRTGLPVGRLPAGGSPTGQGLPTIWIVSLGVGLLIFAFVVYRKNLHTKLLDAVRRSDSGATAESSAAVSNADRIEEFEAALDRGALDELKAEIPDTPTELIDAMVEDKRTDVAEFLLAYDEEVDFDVVDQKYRSLAETLADDDPSALDDDGDPSPGGTTGSSTGDGEDPTADDGSDGEAPSGGMGETTVPSTEDKEGPPIDGDGEPLPGGVGETTPQSAGDGEEPTTDDGGETRSGGAAGTSTASTRSFSQFRYDAANTGHVRGGGARMTKEPSKGWKYSTDAQPLSPVVENGTVYVVDIEGNVYALDAETGDESWKASVDDAISISVPAVHDGLVYFGSKNGTVYAVDGQNEPKWSEEVGMGGVLSNPATLAPPTVQDGRVFIGDRKGGIHAFDARTGDSTEDSGWHKQLGQGKGIWGKPAYRDGSVYAVSSDNHVARFDAKSGDKRGGGVRADAPIKTNPVLSGSDLYVIDTSGDLHLLDSESQRVIDSWSLGAGPAVAPTVGDDLVFVGAEDGRIAAVDTELSDAEWDCEVDHGGKLRAPFVLGEETLYVVAGQRVYALDPTSGETRWDLMLSREIAVQPALANDTLFVATEDNVRTLDLDGA